MDMAVVGVLDLGRVGVFFLPFGFISTSIMNPSGHDRCNGISEAAAADVSAFDRSMVGLWCCLRLLLVVWILLFPSASCLRCLILVRTGIVSGRLRDVRTESLSFLARLVFETTVAGETGDVRLFRGRSCFGDRGGLVPANNNNDEDNSGDKCKRLSEVFP